jgi:hypothetical protein
MLGRILALVGTWGAALVVLFWGSLPFRWRRVFALFTSACGVAFLILGLRTEGLRESPTVGSILMGAPYVAERVSASASLPYYVVTGVLLALGFIGLAAGEGFVGELSRRHFLNAVVLSWAVTGLRVVLEKAAAPEPWARLIGITWLAHVVGAYFALCLKAEGRGFKDLVLHLAGYAFAVRGAVALIMIVASGLQLGTHYDVSGQGDIYFLGRLFHLEAGAWRSILAIAGFSQLVFWPIYTVLSGLVGAAIGLFLAWAWRGGEMRSERTPPAAPVAG